MVYLLQNRCGNIIFFELVHLTTDRLLVSWTQNNQNIEIWQTIGDGGD